MTSFEDSYQAAYESGLLPGVSLAATNKDGSFKYTKTIGVLSLSTKKPMRQDSILGMASCTKLLTAVCALQCVEKGLLDLDADIAPILPEVGKFGVIIGFDDSKNEAILKPKAGPVTLRQLLTHTSGHTYDQMNPNLLKWRASRGEEPWSGATVPEKAATPLIFQPGTSWFYGSSIDWVGQMIERKTGETLETYMIENIFTPLGIKDLTFWPNKQAHMDGRLASISVLDENSKAVDTGEADMVYGATDCLGGSGIYGSTDSYLTFLQAVLKEDPTLLTQASYVELFKPQLNETCKKSLNNLLLVPGIGPILSVTVPTSVKKNWSFAGLLVEDEEGWMNKNTIVWAGMPCMPWFIDRTAGLCGVAGTQVMPPMAPPIMELHGKFQREIYGVYQNSKK